MSIGDPPVYFASPLPAVEVTIPASTSDPCETPALDFHTLYTHLSLAFGNLSKSYEALYLENKSLLNKSLLQEAALRLQAEEMDFLRDRIKKFEELVGSDRFSNIDLK